MTITPAQLYWISRLDNICGLSIVILVFSIIAIIITGVAWAINEPYDDEDKIPYKKSLRISTTAIIIGALISMFVPTTKEMAMIYVVPAINQSEVIQKDLPELYDLGVQALKDILKPKEN